jgi:hypothetical protein
MKWQICTGGLKRATVVAPLPLPPPLRQPAAQHAVPQSGRQPPCAALLSAPAARQGLRAPQDGGSWLFQTTHAFMHLDQKPTENCGARRREQRGGRGTASIAPCWPPRAAWCAHRRRQGTQHPPFCRARTCVSPPPACRAAARRARLGRPHPKPLPGARPGPVRPSAPGGTSPPGALAAGTSTIDRSIHPPIHPSINQSISPRRLLRRLVPPPVACSTPLPLARPRRGWLGTGGRGASWPGEGFGMRRRRARAGENVLEARE